MRPALLVALAVAATGSIGPLHAAPQANTHSSWWIDTHGAATLPAGEEAAVTRTFDRIKNAAGQRAKLVVLEGRADQPFAFALSSGEVIINRALLTTCERFAEGDTSRRDDLLAFVLAHELSHLIAGDSRPYAGFAGEAELRRLGTEAKSRREIQADARGFELTIRAGYDVHTVLEAVRRGFFAAIGRDDAIAAARRARALPAELDTLASRAEEYHFGVLLLALGRLEDGLLLMERLAEVYQGREVLNDLAVAHLRSASRLLAACDGSLVSRLRLPTIIDGRTLVERARLRGAATRSPCYDDSRFTTHVEAAIDLLERAMRSDETYLPARHNLISAHLLAGSPAAALDVAQKALALVPDDITVLVGLGVAFAEFGSDVGLAESVDQALEYLDRADAVRPTALSAWNRAAIEARRGRESAAATSWRRALQLEPRGPWADVARERLGLGPATEPTRPAGGEIPAPIPLGSAAGEAEGREVPIGTFRARLLRRGEAQALAIRGVIELVEAPAPRAWNRAALEVRLGPPLAVEPTAAGLLIHWRGLMAEEVGGTVSRLVWSTPRPEGRPPAPAAGH